MNLVTMGQLWTYWTRQLSLLALVAVYASNFCLGTRVRHPFKKRPETRKRFGAMKPSFSNLPQS